MRLLFRITSTLYFTLHLACSGKGSLAFDRSSVLCNPWSEIWKTLWIFSISFGRWGWYACLPMRTLMRKGLTKFSRSFLEGLAARRFSKDNQLWSLTKNLWGLERLKALCHCTAAASWSPCIKTLWYSISFCTRSCVEVVSDKRR